MTGKRVGLCICGSFCNFSQALPVIRALSCSNEVTPVLSFAAQDTDTRFYKAADFINDVISATRKTPVLTLSDAEKTTGAFDIILILPCTGNTLAKLARGICDTPPLMAAKAHLRNGKPLVIAFSSNDALSSGAANIGELLNRKNVYFVPFSQDDPDKKPRSAASRFGLCEKTLEKALEGVQLEPILA
ncbi:MAG: dipicolinate synthase subunit B [Clostridia bacterium]|nr:dipicolinate synthase subunit B [Clostridia bacterium]